MEQEDVFFSQQLDSGVQVVGQPMPGVQSAAIGILIGTGARDEQPDTFGVTHFTEQMLFRGTEHLDARQLSDRFDALGISYDTTAGIEMTVVSAVLLGDKVPAALDLLADVVRFPAFPDEAMDKVRALLLQEIRQREDQSGQKVMDVLRQQFFAGSPIGHDVLGTEDTISSLRRSDLLGYWSDRYTANNMVVSIAGNFDWGQTIDQLTRITASWPQGRGRMVMHEPQPHAGITVMEQDKTQEHLGFAFPAVAISDPHYYAGAVVAQALGGGSNSRLFREVREKRGLAYAAQARVDGLEKIGLYRIYVGTSAERAHESVEVVIDELRKLEQGGVTEDELQLAKTRLKSQVIMRSESTSARMTSNLRSWWYEQKLRSLQDVKDEVDRVTLDEIDDLVKSLGITRSLAAAALGPRSEHELFGGILASS